MDPGLFLAQLEPISGIEPGSLQFESVTESEARPAQVIDKSQQPRIELSTRQILTPGVIGRGCPSG